MQYVHSCCALTTSHNFVLIVLSVQSHNVAAEHVKIQYNPVENLAGLEVLSPRLGSQLLSETTGDNNTTLTSVILT